MAGINPFDFVTTVRNRMSEVKKEKKVVRLTLKCGKEFIGSLSQAHSDYVEIDVNYTVRGCALNVTVSVYEIAAFCFPEQ